MLTSLSRCALSLCSFPRQLSESVVQSCHSACAQLSSSEPCSIMQMAVEDGQMQANVHITPMRASRALALRYLATKFSTDTENIAVHSC